MFFILSKILSFLTAPTTWIITLLTFGVFFKKHKWSKKALKSGMILLLIFTNPWLATSVFKAWEIEPTPLEKIEKHDIAVVFSGMTISGKKPDDRIYFNKASDRIMMAVHLYKINKVDKILISGGKGTVVADYRPESESLNDFLLMLGIPEDDIIIENRSNNTYQNAAYTKEIINKRYKGSNLILITSAFHMRRAVGCCKNINLEVTPFACDYYTIPEFNTPQDVILPNSVSLKSWDILCHEIIGYLVYWITGKLA